MRILTTLLAPDGGPARVVNPFTITVDAMRSLFLGTPANGAVWQATGRGVGLVVVFAPLAVLTHRRVSAR